MLVQVSIRRCHPKFTRGRAETGISAGEEEQEYEDVYGGEGVMPVSEYSYMEVRDSPIHGNTFQLRKNEAYRVGNVIKLTKNEAYATHV